MDREGMEIFEQSGEMIQKQESMTPAFGTSIFEESAERTEISQKESIPEQNCGLAAFDSEADSLKESEKEPIECSSYTQKLVKQGMETIEQQLSEEKEENVNVSVNLSEITAKIASMEECIEKLCTSIDERNRKDAAVLQNYRTSLDNLRISLAANQRNEDKIYKELEIAKKDERFLIIRPFLEFIVERHFELVKSLKEYEQDKDDIVSKYTQEGYDEIVDMIQFQIEMYENELIRQGIDIRCYEAETDFDVIYQTPGKVVMTKEKEKIGKVAKVDSCCYIYNEKVLRKARVCLYKEEV